MQMLDEKELASRWKVSVRTVRKWRLDGKGPAYLKIEGAVRYRLSDVLAKESQYLQGGCPAEQGENA